tara:strand:- start:20 stop:2689 length:2670 start_codon:yes stop_codon:yes gene_type:complete
MRWSLEHFGLALGSTQEYIRKSIFELEVQPSIREDHDLDVEIKALLNHAKLSGLATEKTLLNRIGHVNLYCPIPRPECVHQIIEVINRAVEDEGINPASDDDTEFYVKNRLRDGTKGAVPDLRFEDDMLAMDFHFLADTLTKLEQFPGFDQKIHIIGNEQITHNVMGMPREMMLDVLPIPSILARAKNPAMNEILNKIITLNYRVGCLAEMNAPPMILADLVRLVQHYVFCYIDNTIPGLVTFQSEEGEELRGVAQHLGKPINDLQDVSNSIGYEIAGTSIQRIVRCLNSGERVIQVTGGDVGNLCFEMAKQCAFQLLWPDSNRTTQCFHVNQQGLVEEMLIEEIHGTNISPWTGEVDLPPDVIINVKPRELSLAAPTNPLFLQKEKQLEELDPSTSLTFRERVTASFIYDQVRLPEGKTTEQKIIIVENSVDYLIMNQAYRMLKERILDTNIALIIHTRWSDTEEELKNMALFSYKPTPDAHRNVLIGLAELANKPEFSKHKTYFESLGQNTISQLTLLMKHIPRQMVRRLLGSTMIEFGNFDLDFLKNWVAEICQQHNFDSSHLHPTVSREKIDLQPKEDETVEEVPEEPPKVEEITNVESGNSWDSLKGLDSFVNWAKGMGRLFSPEAKEYGFVRYPTGVILTGVPGCGKTMAAKIIANEWGMGFKRISVDMVTGRFVGENEENMKKLLEDLEKNAPTVCFVDEAEKLFAQVRTGNLYQAADAGRDGTESILLQFMEENNSGVFFVFTSNDIGKLSPALVDRFDERFFVDLPSEQSRAEMIASFLEERKKPSKNYDLKQLAKMSQGFTGRDIRSAIEEAMMNSFMQERILKTADLVDSFGHVSPTSVTLKTEIDAMRELVLDGKARLANTHENVKKQASAFDPSIG